jgi:hypothetical protein
MKKSDFGWIFLFQKTIKKLEANLLKPKMERGIEFFSLG